MALVKTHFPEWSYDDETYFLACLLHDIGTAERYLASTKMSFEFKGAIVARDLILALKGHEDQADSVCDAIVRHQDIFVKGGNITMIGQILQLATILGECRDACLDGTSLTDGDLQTTSDCESSFTLESNVWSPSLYAVART